MAVLTAKRVLSVHRCEQCPFYLLHSSHGRGLTLEYCTVITPKGRRGITIQRSADGLRDKACPLNDGGFLVMLTNPASTENA